MFADSIKGENYGFALDMLEINPELACGGSGRGTWALYTVAEMPIAFSSRNLLGNLKIWMYNFMDVPPPNVYNKRDEENLPQTSRSQYPSTFKRVKDEVFLMVLRCLKGLMSNVLKIDVEQEILNMKNKHIQARELLKKMCNPNSTSDPKQTEAYFEATKRAIKCGNAEFVEEVLRSNPTLLWGNKESGSIFHMAIACRQERIWNLFYGFSIANRNKITEILVESHSMLHIAACPVVLSKVIGRPDGTSEKQGEQQFWKVFSHAPGAAMEVQREVQWYKEVERVVPSSQKFLSNENGETPPALFWKWHCELVKEGENWMRDTATSCTIVATLIVTVMFAAAFTLPGGTDDNSGNPKFLQRNSFMVFVISDALSLFSSVTSVLMFLSILTSHYAEKDFLKSLPKRLIIGLATLFLSIATMMVAFGATLVIVLGEQISWAAAPVSLLASVPVTLFALLQFPLFVNMVSSTYGHGIFNRKTKSLFV
ncbi:ankyrin repeat-containing protein ITN1-like [Cornus florida]|uniref:ankyrin repeat-containing protein ITN1-like n=1 Tax=Cornus florida TaxID=4283 RepID=UPI00289C3A48|nr:ankyrin repeat-containing protein ITN1-like [Cornus florida]